MLDNSQKFKLKKWNTCLNLPKFSREQVGKNRFFKVEFCKIEIPNCSRPNKLQPLPLGYHNNCKIMIWILHAYFQTSVATLFNHIIILNEFEKVNNIPT